MIHSFYSKSEKLVIAIYDGAISIKDVEIYEEFIHRSFSELNDYEKITNITDLSHGKLINANNAMNRLANLTESYKSRTQKIYIRGMGAFAKILFRTYLKIVNDEGLHIVSDEDLSKVCYSFGLQTPKIYYKINGFHI